MNSRLAELAEQAGYKELPIARLAFQGFDEKKFAELIIKECCFTGEQWANGLINPVHYAFVNKKIKEHFGVEQ